MNCETSRDEQKREHVKPKIAQALAETGLINGNGIIWDLLADEMTKATEETCK